MSKIEKYDRERFKNLQEDNPEGDGIRRTLLQGKVIARKTIGGERYVQLYDKVDDLTILFTEDLHEDAKEILCSNMLKLIKDGNEESLGRLLLGAIKKEDGFDWFEDVFYKVNQKLLIRIYINFHKDLKALGVDFSKYISLERLYNELSEIKDSFIQYEQNMDAEASMMALEQCKREIDEKVEKKGGLKAYISGKSYNKRNKNVYLKSKVINQIISGEGNLDEKISILYEMGFNKKDISELIDAGELKPTMIKQMYNIPQLKTTILQGIGELTVENILITYANLGDIEALEFVKWNTITEDKIKEVLQKNTKYPLLLISEFIVAKFKFSGKTFSKQEIDSIFEAKNFNIRELTRSYFELIRNGLYEEDAIINLYIEQIQSIEENLQSEYDVEETTKVVKVGENIVTQDHLLEFFSPEKVIEKNRKYNEAIANGEKKAEFAKKRFNGFYSSLIYIQKIGKVENTQKIVETLKELLEKNVKEGNKEDLLIAIDLFREEAIEDLENILTEENEEMIFDLYGEGIDDETLVALYESRAISEDIINMVYEEEIEKESIKEKIENEKISVSEVVTLFSLGLINIEELQEVAGNEIDWVKIIKAKKEKGIEININELYSKEIIKYEDIERLKTEGVIGAAQATAILNQIDLEAILQNGLKSEEVDGEETGQTKSGKRPRNKKEQLPIEDREVLLEALGFEATKNKKGDTLVIAKGSFEGYRVYKEVEEKYGVLIFEKDGEGSSFIMHKAKAAEFIKKSGDKATLVGRRRDWREESRTSGNVKSRAHSKNWSRNIINTIVEVGSTFMFDDEEERAQYIKTENAKLQEENEDIIEYLITVKEEAKII